MVEDNFIPCLRESEIKEGQMKAARIKGRPILFVRISGQVYGVSNLCPHMGCSFERGILRGFLVMCPCDGWKFDIQTGQLEGNSAIKLSTYVCKILNGRIYVKLEERG